MGGEEEEEPQLGLMEKLSGDGEKSEPAPGLYLSCLL